MSRSFSLYLSHWCCTISRNIAVVVSYDVRDVLQIAKKQQDRVDSSRMLPRFIALHAETCLIAQVSATIVYCEQVVPFTCSFFDTAVT